jgi:hypothetical protein
MGNKDAGCRKIGAKFPGMVARGIAIAGDLSHWTTNDMLEDSGILDLITQVEYFVNRGFVSNRRGCWDEVAVSI